MKEILDQIKAMMVDIPAGVFLMGSPEDEPERCIDEDQKDVSIDAFQLAATTVTFAEWDAIMGEQYRPDDNGWGRGNRPVINVNWDDAQEFIERLNTMTGEQYRLPSEVEWEYACRAGTTTRFNTGDCITTDQANFDGGYPAKGCPEGEYRKKTLPVGSFAKNAFGLYDMHGNVWEWVEDCRQGDPELRVLRGGSWGDGGRYLRSAFRNANDRGYRSDGTGLRLARDV